MVKRGQIWKKNGSSSYQTICEIILSSRISHLSHVSFVPRFKFVKVLLCKLLIHLSGASLKFQMVPKLNVALGPCPSTQIFCYLLIQARLFRNFFFVLCVWISWESHLHEFIFKMPSTLIVQRSTSLNVECLSDFSCRTQSKLMYCRCCCSCCFFYDW